eukprot:1157233-Pelagomonas_calceolata.AAC.8
MSPHNLGTAPFVSPSESKTFGNQMHFLVKPPFERRRLKGIASGGKPYRSSVSHLLTPGHCGPHTTSGPELWNALITQTYRRPASVWDTPVHAALSSANFFQKSCGSPSVGGLVGPNESLTKHQSVVQGTSAAALPSIGVAAASARAYVCGGPEKKCVVPTYELCLQVDALLKELDLVVTMSCGQRRAKCAGKEVTWPGIAELASAHARTHTHTHTHMYTHTSMYARTHAHLHGLNQARACQFSALLATPPLPDPGTGARGTQV